MNDVASIVASVPPRRPWYRLHASTCVVGALAALVLAVIVASPVCANLRQRQMGDQYERGWPWAWATYRGELGPAVPPPTIPLIEPPHRPAWVDWRLWRLSEPRISFAAAALVGDIAVSFGVVIGLAGAFEWWRRWRARVWQFHLADVLAATTLVAAFMAWWLWWQHDTAHEAAALATLRPSSSSGTSYCGPAWLPRLTGHRWCPPMFYRTTWLILDEVNLTDQTTSKAAALQACRFVTGVTLHKTAVPNEIWDALVEKRLKAVNCDPAALNDDVLVKLGRVPTLQYLEAHDVGTTTIGERGLAAVGQLRELQLLSLCGARFPPQATRHLARLQKLTRLDLNRTPLDDEGLRHIAQLSALSALHIDNTQVTDAGIRYLANSHQLWEIYLANTAVSDDCLDVLLGLPMLHHVFAQNTRITAAAAERARQAQRRIGLTIHRAGN